MHRFRREQSVASDLEPRYPEALGDVLGRLISQRGWGREQGLRQIEDAWSEIADPEWAARSCVVRLLRGRLEVVVSSSVLLQELATFEKARLLRALQDRLGAERIRDIQFRIGTVDQPQDVRSR